MCRNKNNQVAVDVEDHEVMEQLNHVTKAGKSKGVERKLLDVLNNC